MDSCRHFADGQYKRLVPDVTQAIVHRAAEDSRYHVQNAGNSNIKPPCAEDGPRRCKESHGGWTLGSTATKEMAEWCRDQWR